MSDVKPYGMGWLHDYPDFRDYTPDHDKVSDERQKLGQHDSVKAMLTKAGIGGAKKVKLSTKVDLSPWCSAVEDQGHLGSCTANAGVGLVEYFENRAFSKYTDASRLFLYKVTRNLAHLNGDSGAFLRNTMGAMAMFGVPPEEYWPYNISEFDAEPPAFCYAFAQNFHAITYYRLDPPETKTDALLSQIKQHLNAYIPAMFGFTVFSSYTQAKTTGKIPFPIKGDPQRKMKVSKIVEFLSSYSKHKSHGRPVSLTQAQNIGLKAFDLATNPQLQEKIWELYYRVEATFDGMRWVKLFIGRSYFVGKLIPG